MGGSSAVALLLGLLNAVLVARLLGVDGFAQWTLVVAAGALLNNVLIGWTHGSTVRFGAEEWASHRTLRRTFGGRLPVLASCAAVAGMLLLVQPGQWLDRLFGVSPDHWWLVGLYSISLWLAAEVQAILRATDRLHVQAWLTPVARGIAVAALLPLFWLPPPSLTLVVFLVTVPPVFVWTAAWVASLRGAGVGVRRLPLDDAPRQLRYGWPLLPAFAVGYVSEWGDHILLRHLTSAAEVGLFGLAYQVFMLLLVANGLFTTVLQPRLIVAEMRAPGTVLTYLREVVPTLLTLWMILSLWVIAATPPLLAWMGGESFEGAVAVIVVLCVAVPASVITHLYGIVLGLEQRLSALLRYAVTIASANLLVSLALIPAYGAIGAAAGTAFAYVLGQALYFADQYRRTMVSPVPTVYLWATGVAAAVAQVPLDDSVAARLVWALLATAAVAVVARRVGAVAPTVMTRLFPGPLQRVGTALNVALVSSRPSVQW